MLSIRFQLDDLDEAEPVVIEERRGDVKYLLSKGLFIPEHAATLTCATAGLLAGRHLYQMWRGELIAANTLQNGEAHARIHRGPLVD